MRNNGDYTINLADEEIKIKCVDVEGTENVLTTLS